MELFHSHFSESQKQGFGNFPFSVKQIHICEAQIKSFTKSLDSWYILLWFVRYTNSTMCL